MMQSRAYLQGLVLGSYSFTQALLKVGTASVQLHQLCLQLLTLLSGLCNPVQGLGQLDLAAIQTLI